MLQATPVPGDAWRSPYDAGLKGSSWSGRSQPSTPVKTRKSIQWSAPEKAKMGGDTWPTPEKPHKSLHFTDVRTPVDQPGDADAPRRKWKDLTPFFEIAESLRAYMDDVTNTNAANGGKDVPAIGAGERKGGGNARRRRRKGISVKARVSEIEAEITKQAEEPELPPTEVRRVRTRRSFNSENLKAAVESDMKLQARIWEEVKARAERGRMRSRARVTARAAAEAKTEAQLRAENEARARAQALTKVREAREAQRREEAAARRAQAASKRLEEQKQEAVQTQQRAVRKQQDLCDTSSRAERLRLALQAQLAAARDEREAESIRRQLEEVTGMIDGAQALAARTEEQKKEALQQVRRMEPVKSSPQQPQASVAPTAQPKREVVRQVRPKPEQAKTAPEQAQARMDDAKAACRAAAELRRAERKKKEALAEQESASRRQQELGSTSSRAAQLYKKLEAQLEDAKSEAEAETIRRQLSDVQSMLTGAEALAVKKAHRAGALEKE